MKPVLRTAGTANQKIPEQDVPEGETEAVY
jgi:hypothetical protein